MADLRTSFAGITMQNPVIAASGTFAFGREYSRYMDLSVLGGISVKGLTLKPRQGNKPPRIAETPSGILNSVGLQNPGIIAFVETELPYILKQNIKAIANIAGGTAEEYFEMAEILSDTGVDAIEANVSCPNVKCGGAAFGTDPEILASVVKGIRKHCKKPLIVKLSPNVTSISEMAKIVEDSGADAVSLINTITGMAVDVHSRRPILGNNTGGLSGPAIKPVALRMVHEVYNAVKIPILGMGGITTGEDAVAFMLCGACAVMVGTASFMDPTACALVKDGIEAYLDKYGFKSVSDIVGILELN